MAIKVNILILTTLLCPFRHHSVPDITSIQYHSHFYSTYLQRRSLQINTSESSTTSEIDLTGTTQQHQQSTKPSTMRVSCLSVSCLVAGAVATNPVVLQIQEQGTAVMPSLSQDQPLAPAADGFIEGLDRMELGNLRFG